MKILMKSVKYACCCAMIFVSVIFIFGPLTDVSKNSKFLVFPIFFLLSGYFTYASAKRKALEGPGVFWWLYGMFVPFISWRDVAKTDTLQAVKTSLETRQNRILESLGVKWEMWEMEHDKPEQQKRWMKAAKDCSLVKMLDDVQGVAVVKGNRGGEYTTSLVMCSCSDFAKRHKPCKHMYFLAHHLGIFDPFNMQV